LNNLVITSLFTVRFRVLTDASLALGCVIQKQTKLFGLVRTRAPRQAPPERHSDDGGRDDERDDEDIPAVAHHRVVDASSTRG
jgi:hypothetical protein